MCKCKEMAVHARAGMEALNMGRPFDALEKLKTALQTAQDAGSPVHQAKIRNSMGLVFQQLGLRAEAEQNYRLALRLVKARVGEDNRVYRTIASNLDGLSAACASTESV